MSAIGVFDSGVGGLSVLKALQDVLPLETFIYVSDAGYAPYGERDGAHVLHEIFVAHHPSQTHGWEIAPAILDGEFG